MQLIESSAELINTCDPFKQVERIGRVCYKSESQITETSCHQFVDNLIRNQHFAMLEHARFVFLIHESPVIDEISNIPGIVVEPLVSGNCVVSISLSHLYNPEWNNRTSLFAVLRNFVDNAHSIFDNSLGRPYLLAEGITGTLIDDISLLDHMQFKVEGASRRLKYHSIKFICDRGVSHELVRHRVSVAQESTRYCNYSKDKFGNQVTFIKPANYDTEFSDTAKVIFETHLEACERAYFSILNDGLSPQQARAVLPNALKTEVVLTMNEWQWEHFFQLRKFGTTGKPHPDMEVVATKAYEIFKTIGVNFKKI